jgi:predicted O-linked N-acetylglucosamine transferase (SPINDLY family)
LPQTIANLFADGLQHHRGGRLPEAEAMYRKILAREPAHADALHSLAVAAQQAGRFAEALELLDRAIAANPAEARYHVSRGQVLAALRKLQEAIAAYRRATALAPELTEAWFGLGIVLQASGQAHESMVAYRRAVELKPDHVEAHNNLGNAWQILGNRAEAIAAYQRALAIKPEYVDSLNNLGIALMGTGDVTGAIEQFQKVISLQPEFVRAYNNLGCALLRISQPARAEKVLLQAITLQPNFAEAWYNLGNAQSDQSEFAKAVESYQRAVAIRPDYGEAFNNLGNVLQARRNYDLAADAYRKAIALNSNDVEAINNLGCALRTMGDTDGSIDAFEQVLKLQPDFHKAYCNLGNVLKDTGDVEAAIASYRKAVELCPADSISQSNLAFASHYHPTYSAEDILRENLRWNDLHAQTASAAIMPHENDRDPERPLRIGYFGADFRDHCQSLFTLPLLANHDHRQFEIFAYPNVSRSDAVTEKLRPFFDNWRTVKGIPDEDSAAMIRGDRIDILVDLTMHMSGGRPLLMARKPAPVQVAWLAYPGTTGLAAMDYRLTDPYLDPPGESNAHYSEQSIRLPETFWCYDAQAPDVIPNALPVLSTGRITFGCLNNFCKVTPATLELWAKVLLAVDDSRLILLAAEGRHRRRVIDFFFQRGVSPGRIEFVGFRPRIEYLQTYHRIDIGLDTLPYNGHTTSLDSFWMGVPVITKLGRTAVGRAGFSQLSNLDLAELAALTDEDFVKIATYLAADVSRLSRLRMTLRQRMEKSPLMDGPRFARNIESTYRTLWRKWCQA